MSRSRSPGRPGLGRVESRTGAADGEGMDETPRPRTRAVAAEAPDRSSLKLALFAAGLIAAAILIPCGAHVAG